MREATLCDLPQAFLEYKRQPAVHESFLFICLRMLYIVVGTLDTG